VNVLENKYENHAKVFKAMCDPNRLIIIEMLQSGEKCACKILEDLNIGQSTLSHHMKILCESGLVSSRREGKWMHYSLNKEGCEAAKLLLTEYTTAIY
jgi:ArsR family transcriptional regulator